MNPTWMVLPVMVGAVLLADASGCSAREPAKMASPDDQLILESFLRHAAGAPNRFTPAAVARIDQPEDICWVWVNYARLPLAAYLLTGQTTYLDGFVRAMDGLLARLREGPDGYKGFRGLPLELFRNPQTPDAQVDVDIAEFEVARLIADFVECVRAEES
ncbi:MAG: hypothetical protein QHJ73_02765, partial [Armatimonadota bacterium]|nr:hypothetical protein [Armatimonadota bacterium]